MAPFLHSCPAVSGNCFPRQGRYRRIRASQRKPKTTPMTDSLGFRKKFAVIAPSTNTSVQPEFDAMAPRGVTNHFGRISIPNDPIHNDDDFNKLMDNIRTTMMETVD